MASSTSITGGRRSGVESFRPLQALAAGDYGVANGPDTIAVVERKTLENLVASLSDGTMAFQMQRLGEVGRAAVVVEGGTPPSSSLSTFRPH